MTETEALVQLFELLFGHADLQRFVESRVRAAGIDGARAAVQALELQGAVDAALFDRLREAFPSRAAEIEQAARDWLPDWTAAAPPARPAAAAEPESGARDIFIAHAGPDAPAAEVLCDALVDTDHEPGEASLAARLYQRMRSGAERHGVRVRRLPEVTPVTWKHVEYFLDGFDPPPDARVYRRLRELHDQLDHDRISFQDLAERLSRRL